MEQLMVLGEHTNRKRYVRTRPMYSMVHSPRTVGSGGANTARNTRDGRIVFPGHVIQLRCDITMNRVKSLPASREQPDSSRGRLKSGRLLPMGGIHDSNVEKHLGIITARQALVRTSTTPIQSTRGAVRLDRVKRRVQSAIPSSHTSMRVDDLLTVSATNVRGKTRLHHKKQDTEDSGHKQHKDESVQDGESMATITDNSIKVKVMLGHQSHSEHTELPPVTETNKQESKQFMLTANTSSVKKSCHNSSKLSPLIGIHTKLPIGTLNGNSFNLTCKNESS